MNKISFSGAFAKSLKLKVYIWYQESEQNEVIKERENERRQNTHQDSTF